MFHGASAGILKITDDKEITEEDIEELKKKKETITTFIVSQRTSSIRFADKIVVLEDGKIAGLGTHKELLETCDVYREIYESQYQNPEEEVQYE